MTTLSNLVISSPENSTAIPCITLAHINEEDRDFITYTGTEGGELIYLEEEQRGYARQNDAWVALGVTTNELTNMNVTNIEQLEIRKTGSQEYNVLRIPALTSDEISELTDSGELEGGEIVHDTDKKQILCREGTEWTPISSN